jgi:hypothetical protein
LKPEILASDTWLLVSAFIFQHICTYFRRR